MRRTVLLAASSFRTPRKLFKRGSRRKRLPTAFLSAIVLAAALVAQPSRAIVPSPTDQLRLQALLTCYAYAFDSIDRATLAMGDVPLDSVVNFDNDPRWAEGADRFLGCTTDDFSINILFRGNLVARFRGALAWLNFVSNQARAEGRRDSQHMMGTFYSDVRRRPPPRSPQKGKIIAYSIIRIMYLPDSPRAGNVDVLTVTYTVTVRKVRGRWKIAHMDFDLKSTSTEAGTPPLDAPPPPAQ